MGYSLMISSTNQATIAMAARYLKPMDGRGDQHSVESMSSHSETEEPSGHKNTFTEDDTSMLTQHSEYVTELLDERARLGKPEQPFKHLPRLIEAEINRFLGSLPTESSRTEKLPKRIMLQEKLI
ncbi:unnamed protein product, partial [Mesorhabditis spiculigera]